MNRDPPAGLAGDTHDPEATVRHRSETVSGAILPGTLLVNTYRVERLLGGGGMGDVYLTRHALLGSQHAVKVIRAAMAVNPQATSLFYREARVLRGVRHDAVVSYEGFVQDAAGREYLVMEYVDGPSLAQLFRQGPLPLAAVLTLRDRLAAGLAQAHRQGAVHRDISPDNVILPGNQVGAAKLIDFGLSKLIEPDQESIIGSAFAGKYRFASPEQFGLYGGAVDPRSDIYSLGLTLAAAALGRPLDRGATFESVLGARQRGPDLTEVPAPLRPWLAAMLEPDPARRPASLDDLLARWPAPGQADAVPRSAGNRERTDRGRVGAPPGWTWPVIGTALAVSAALGGYALLRSPTPPVPTRPADAADPRPGTPGGPPSSVATPMVPDPATKTAPGGGASQAPGGLSSPSVVSAAAQSPPVAAPVAAPAVAVSLLTAPAATAPDRPSSVPATPPSASLAAEDAALARVAEIPPRFVQLALQGLGHYSGTIGGALSAGSSQRAIRAWQAARGLAQTGRLEPGQTVDLLVQAAESGHPQSQNALGIMRASGVGLLQDADAARGWFEKAAAQGDAYAAFNLGGLYRDGEGVTASTDKARAYFEQARRAGHPQAAKALARLR